MRAIYTLVSFAYSAPLGYSTHQSRPNLSARNVCHIEGNADFYGLGIRIGIYLQWIASLLANRYVPDAVRNLLITNTIFLLAVSIVAAQSTSAKTLRKAEALTLQHLCFGFLFSILTIWGYRVRAKIKSKVGFSLAETSFRLVLSAAICSYGVWFWFVGNKTLSDETCSTVTFVLAKVDTLGPVRYFYQVQSVLLVATYGTLLLRHCFTWLLLAGKSIFSSLLPAVALTAVDKLWDGGKHYTRTFLRRWGQTAPLRFWIAINGRSLIPPHIFLPRSALDFPILNVIIYMCWAITQFISLIITKRAVYPKTPPFLKLDAGPVEKREVAEGKRIPTVSFRMKKFLGDLDWSNILSLLNAICIAWAVAATELTLVWNEVSDVYAVSSTGQLIPLIIGIANFAQITYTIVLSHTQVLLTDMLLKSFVLPRKTESKKKKGQDDLVTPTIESEQYPIGRGYEAVFWKNCPKRRRSFDVLLPTPFLARMGLGVSPPDIPSMGLEKQTPEVTRRRHHSFSGALDEKLDIRDKSPIIIDLSNPTTPDPLANPKTKIIRICIRLIVKILGALLYVLFILIRALWKFITLPFRLPRSQEAGQEIAKMTLASYSKEDPLLGLLIERFNKNIEEMSNDPTTPNSLSNVSPSSSSSSDSFSSTQSRVHASSRTGMAGAWLNSRMEPRNWGPHLTYTPPRATKIMSMYPDGPLHTVLRILFTTASVSMPSHPNLSITMTNFADMFADLGGIYKFRRDGRITREQQDNLFKEWLQDLRRDYVQETLDRFQKRIESVTKQDEETRLREGLKDIADMGWILGAVVEREMEIWRREGKLQGIQA